MHLVKTPLVNLIKEPHEGATAETQILYGELVEILDQFDDFYKVKLIQKNDTYTGYVNRACIDTCIHMPSHRVVTRSTLVFKKPDIKTPDPKLLSIGSLVSIKDQYNDQFYITYDDTYILTKHVLPSDQYFDFSPRNWINLLSQHFIQAPYLWGGRSSWGIDCSGLVQLSLQQFGIFLPRDSGPQEKFLTMPQQQDTLTAGDLVFWPGHVGIMINADDVIHANAFHMKTVIEPLDNVIKRNDKPVSSFKKLAMA